MAQRNVRWIFLWWIFLVGGCLWANVNMYLQLFRCWVGE